MDTAEELADKWGINHTNGCRFRADIRARDAEWQARLDDPCWFEAWFRMIGESAKRSALAESEALRKAGEIPEEVGG